MKTTTAIVAVATLMGLPAVQAGEGKSFKQQVIVEEAPKWWGAALSTGYDSLYMFRGVNVLRNDMHYGSGLYWTDLNATWNITENDSLNVGTWVAFGLSKTNYKEFDVYTSYTRTFGDLSLSFGYSFYYVWSEPLYAHELNTTAAYTFDLGFVSITPSLAYYFNLGPEPENKGIAPAASSYLLPRVDLSFPITDWLALETWTSFGINFRYNADESGHFFNGGNDLQVGIGLPVKVNDIISLYGYVAYSYQWNDLVGTRPSTFWAGGKVSFEF